MATTITSRYVTRQPEILSGEPIIVGTRTQVRVRSLDLVGCLNEV